MFSVRSRLHRTGAVFSFIIILALAVMPACEPAPAEQPATVAQNTQDTTPTLTVDPPTISEQFTEGKGNTVTETVNVHNDGGGVMIWAATESPTWMWLDSANGALERGTMAQFTVYISPSTLVAGTYTGDINIEGASAKGSPQVVKVTMVVNPAPPPATDAGTSLPKKAVPPPPWDYNQYKDSNYKVVLKYPTSYQTKQLPVSGATFGAVSSSNTNSSDTIMVVVTGSYGMAGSDVVMEVAKNAIRVAGGRPNPKVTSFDNTTTLADGVTPAYEYVIDSKSSGAPSYEFYAFGFQKGSRFIFFAATSTLDVAASKLTTWKQIGQTLEVGD